MWVCVFVCVCVCVFLWVDVCPSVGRWMDVCVCVGGCLVGGGGLVCVWGGAFGGWGCMSLCGWIDVWVCVGGVLVGVEGVCVCVFDWSLSACLLFCCCHFVCVDERLRNVQYYYCCYALVYERMRACSCNQQQLTRSSTLLS